MKTSCYQTVMLALLVLAHNASCSEQCSGVEPKAPAELEKKVSHLETLANAGRPWKPGTDGGYFVAAARLAEQIKESPLSRNRGKLAAKVLDGLLSKDVNLREIASEELGKDEKDDDVVTSDLRAAETLAYCVLDDDAASDQDRLANARLVARFLGRIRKEKVRNFQNRKVTMNVAPPIDAPGEGMAAGMDPDDIKDPAAKAAYKAAILQNEENNVWNERQSELNSMDQPPIIEAIKKYIADAFRRRPNSGAALAECMKTAMLTEKEKKEIMDDIGSENAQADR